MTVSNSGGIEKASVMTYTLQRQTASIDALASTTKSGGDPLEIEVAKARLRRAPLAKPDLTSA